VRRVAAAGAALAVAGAVAACGSPASSSGPAAAPAKSVAAVSMATSLATAQETWAIVPLVANPTFWQLLSRSASSATWNLVTPPGVAINGGMVASADGPDSLSVAVRPSDKLTFSPLAATSNGGSTWSTGGPLDAAVASSPDAFAASGGELVALLSDGTIETSADAGTSWSTLAKPTAKDCEPVRVTALSFGISATQVLAGGTCGTGGATAVFSYSPGSGWQRLSLPASGQLVRFANGMALVRGKSGLSALWYGLGWHASAPLSGTSVPSQPASWASSAPLPVSGTVTASGTLASGGAWVLLSGGRAATVSSSGAATGKTPQWVLLPQLPARTAVLASGPDGAVDALAVSGASVSVWQLAPAATTWSKVEAISVPIQYGSSS
jgi:hypothetical protein